MKNDNSERIASLFTGTGAFERAFIEIGGFVVVWANEIDKFACQTYRANNPTHNLIEGDIRKIKVKQIPQFDILLAGFPCQPWSVAQSKKEKGLNDDRGHLFKEILRVLKYHKPSYFLLENVKGLLNKRNKEIFDIIIKELESLGYKVDYKVLNAKNYGLPQNRERVFIIGNRYRLEFEWPEPLNTPTKIKDILEEKVDKKYYLSEKAWKSLKEHKKRNQTKGNGFGFTTFSETDQVTNTIRSRYHKDGHEILIFQHRKRNDPNRSNFEYLSNEISPTLPSAMRMGGNHIPLVVFQNRRGRIRENKENISPTLTSNMGGGGNNMPFISTNGSTPRKLTPRECLRLQGFTDDFKIVVSNSQIYKQVGNAVAIPVVKAIAEQIKRLWINIPSKRAFKRVKK